MLSVDFCTCSDHDVGAYVRSFESHQIGLVALRLSDCRSLLQAGGPFLKAQERSMRGRFGRSVLWAQTTDLELLILPDGLAAGSASLTD
jgi:hypothetical protein